MAPKAKKPPPPPAPAAIPDVGPEAPEMAVKRARRRRGFERTLTMALGRQGTLGG